MALGHGLHTDMPAHILGNNHVERCRRIWWTVYMLDRDMTSLLGLPQSIADDDICPTLPEYAGSEHYRTMLAIRIQLCGTIARINRSKFMVILVYAQMLTQTFLQVYME